MASFNYCIPFSLLLAAGSLRADESKTPKAGDKPEYRRPELVAIAWQDSTRPGSDRPYNSVWREDGSLIEGEELEWLRNDLTTFNGHYWDTKHQLRPLVFVFRIDERAKSPQTLMGGLVVNGQSRRSGSGHPSTPSFLAKTAVAPDQSQLATWPNLVDVEIRVPIGEPETLKSFDRLPDGDIKVADGVRWYVDKTRGMRLEKGKRQAGFPAAVLEINNRIADPLSTIGATVRLNDGRVLSEDYVTLTGNAGIVEVRVSAPLDESNPIVSGEFKRLRYRLEHYQQLPTRLELKPEDPVLRPGVQGIPLLRAF